MMGLYAAYCWSNHLENWAMVDDSNTPADKDVAAEAPAAHKAQDDDGEAVVMDLVVNTQPVDEVIGEEAIAAVIADEPAVEEMAAQEEAGVEEQEAVIADEPAVEEMVVDLATHDIFGPVAAVVDEQVSAEDAIAIREDSPVEEVPAADVDIIKSVTKEIIVPTRDMLAETEVAEEPIVDKKVLEIKAVVEVETVDEGIYLFFLPMRSR
jgi:hypothetical protein